ncbi:MAG TPA: hypothetical protein VMH80_17280 [Bryobacteraceae bacterium]|nr:hypothetical protein [Bryobacteraceae bacterium]
MNRLWIAVTAMSFLLSVPVARAQFGEPTHYDAASVTALTDQVQSDLNQAYRTWHFSNGDRGRLNHAEKELREFARTWQNYHFNKGELDDAISSIQHVLDNNRLNPGSRDALSEDVSRLRNMREAYDHHEIR